MIEHDVAYGLERAIELAPNDGCTITLTIGECGSLVSRLRQAEKDAARYRWLRECNWNLSVACVVVDPKKSVKLGCDCPSGDRLDELVDAHL